MVIPSPEIVDLLIEKLGAQGDGLARWQGQPLAVAGALAGERVRVKLRCAKGSKRPEAELLEVLTPSPARGSALCPHYSVCGGCSLQHLQAQAALAHKQQVVRGALQAQGLDVAGVRPVHAITGGVRRRLALAARWGKGKVVLGFNQRRSTQIFDLSTCVIARPALLAALPQLRAALQVWLQEAKALDVLLTEASNGLEAVVSGPEPGLPAREAVASLSGVLVRLSWRARERDEPEPVFVREPPRLQVGAASVLFPAGGFLQPSVEGEHALLTYVQAALAGLPAGRIADLFCGLGTFALPLSQTQQVLAVDGEGSAIQALAACRNSRIEAVQRDLFRDPLNVKELKGFQAVICDPPRAGAQAQTAELAKSDVPVVVMVSCNPGTFARDAASLVAGGYQLDWVQPIDQFEHSSHIELVARFVAQGR